MKHETPPLITPNHLLDRFWGPKDRFFGFSSRGYQGKGDKENIMLPYRHRNQGSLDFLHSESYEHGAMIIDGDVLHSKCYYRDKLHVLTRI